MGLIKLILANQPTNLEIEQMRLLKVAPTIYMRADYVFDLRFLESKIQPISMIFGILNK